MKRVFLVIVLVGMGVAGCEPNDPQVPPTRVEESGDKQTSTRGESAPAEPSPQQR
jgi:hypothetical protein